MNLLELFAMLLHMRCCPKRLQKIKPEKNTVLIAVHGVKLRKPGYLFMVLNIDIKNGQATAKLLPDKAFFSVGTAFAKLKLSISG